MAQDIVIGVDGSEASLEALDAACHLAEQTGSTLSVVFVRDPGLAGAVAANQGEALAAIRQTEAELEATAREQAFDALRDKPVAWTFDLATGDVAHELVNAAKRRNATVIVVGGRRHTTLGGLALGSVGQKLLHSSPISVLVVRHSAADHLVGA